MKSSRWVQEEILVPPILERKNPGRETFPQAPFFYEQKRPRNGDRRINHGRQI